MEKYKRQEVSPVEEENKRDETYEASNPTIAPWEQQDFFMDCVQFFEDKYGEENIISAIVHLDETTPHLHLNEANREARQYTFRRQNTVAGSNKSKGQNAAHL